MLSKLFAAVFIFASVYMASDIHFVRSELKPYYNAYKELLDSQCRIDQYFYPSHTFITLGNLPGDIIGECETNYPRRWNIILDKRFFDRANDEERLQLMAHELRHCFFQVGHVQDPSNYMYPVFPHITLYELYNQINDDLEASCRE